MGAVDNLILKYIDISERGVCVEYGSDSVDTLGEHLYQFEAGNWIVLCIQPDPDVFSVVRTHRRLVLNEKCGPTDSDGSKKLDTILSKTNLKKVDLLLLKRDHHDFYSILNGFDTIYWGTRVIVVEIANDDKRIGEYLGNLGFSFGERIHNYFIFRRDQSYISKEQKSVKKEGIDHIFSV